MKIFLRLSAVCLAAVLVIVLSGLTTTDNNAAFIEKDFGCNLFDGNGTLTSVYDANISIVTSSGNTTLVCKAKKLPNDQGKAVITEGFLCGTFLGTADYSKNTVSASGNVTLTCMVKHE